MNPEMTPPTNEADANELAKTGAEWLRQYGVDVLTEYGAARTTVYPTEWRSWCLSGDYRFDIYRGNSLYDASKVIVVKVGKTTPDHLRTVWFDVPLVIDTRMMPYASDGVREQIAEALKRVDAAAEQEAKAIVTELETIPLASAPVSTVWDEEAFSLHRLKDALYSLFDLAKALINFDHNRKAQALMVKHLTTLVGELAVWAKSNDVTDTTSDEIPF